MGAGRGCQSVSFATDIRQQAEASRGSHTRVSECRFLPLMQENTRECHVGARRESDPVSVATDAGKHAGALRGSYPVSSYLTFLILLLWFEDHPGLGFWGCLR